MFTIKMDDDVLPKFVRIIDSNGKTVDYIFLHHFAKRIDAFKAAQKLADQYNSVFYPEKSPSTIKEYLRTNLAFTTQKNNDGSVKIGLKFDDDKEPFITVTLRIV